MRVNIIAVNIDVAIPIASVTAKPRTGPDPNRNNKIAAIKVVILASIIVRNANRNPISTEENTDLPLRTSSRILSNISRPMCVGGKNLDL